MIRIVKSKEFNTDRTVQNTVPESVVASVKDIIAGVINRGDLALREYTEKFDKCNIDAFEVPPAAIDAAFLEAGADFTGVLERAAKNIGDFHRNQIRQGFVMTHGDGVVLGQRILPLERVGIYIPGGTAAYPSNLLMNCIPAKLAGVREIILATPPSKDGGVDAAILAAAKVAGVTRVFSIGGAQAIAALAYGTETVPRVDKVVGAGNAFVAEAKRQVFGAVGIDMIAGPSDILVIADGNADATLVAADMLSQCEHGADSIAVLITNSDRLAANVQGEIETQLSSLPREGIARESIDKNGSIVISETIEQAFEIANKLAPEHLEIFLNEPFSYLDRVQNAGSVFLGSHTPEALGDYYAGPNNTIPTSGTARFSSPLSVDDFTKKSSFTYYDADALLKVGGDIEQFAEKEGLAAHARSVSRRMKNKEDKNKR